MSKPKRTFDGIDLEIIRLLSEDYIPKQIGDMLHLSNRTVENRIMELKEKMKVRGKAGIVLKGLLMGMIKNPYHKIPVLEYTNQTKIIKDETFTYCRPCDFQFTRVSTVRFDLQTV